MSYQIQTTYISNINKEKQRLASKDRVKPRQTVTVRINTNDIFGNKSENKIKTTTSKFNFQKDSQNQKKIYLVKATKIINNSNLLVKNLIIKNSKNSSVSKPTSMASSANRTISKEDNNNNKEKKIFQTIDANPRDIKDIKNNNINHIVKEINSKTIKSICSNLKYKTNTFIPNRTNCYANNSTNTTINNPFQQNTLNYSQINPNNPFNFMNQPISPMTLEMEIFKKMKMRERKNTEKNMKFKRDYNSAQKKNILNKANLNLNSNKYPKNDFDKLKEKPHLQTEISDKINFNLEKHNTQKMQKDITIQIDDNNIYQINSNNKYNTLFTESEINLNPHDYLSINNSIENNNICSISSSINNINGNEKSKNEKNSKNNKKSSILYNQNKAIKNAVKIANFMTIDDKRMTNNSKKPIDNNINNINNYKKLRLNNIMKTYQVKSLRIHKAKSRKTHNYMTNYQKNINFMKKNNLKKSSNINLNKSNSNEEKLKNNKNINSSKQKIRKVIKIHSKSLHVSNDLQKKNNDELNKESSIKFFAILKKILLKILKIDFELLKKYNLRKEESIKCIKIKKIDILKRINKNKLINNRFMPKNRHKVNPKRNIEIKKNNKTELKKEKNLSSDIINKNNKEGVLSAKSINFIEHQKSYNFNKKIITIKQETKLKEKINNININNNLINRTIQENKIDKKDVQNHEIKNNDLIKSKNIINLNNKKVDNNDLNHNIKSDEPINLNRIILNNKIIKENKLIKGFEIIKQYYYNNLMINKKYVLSKMKDSNNTNKRIEAIERIEIILYKVYLNFIKYLFLKIKVFINNKKKIEGIEKFLLIFSKLCKKKINASFLKLKKYVKSNKKNEGIDKIFNYLNKKINDIMKEEYIKFKEYVYNKRKIEGTERIYNFYLIKLNLCKKNAFIKLKEYINNNKKIEGTYHLYDFLLKKIYLIKTFPFFQLKKYINENKKNESIERFISFFINISKNDINYAFLQLKKFSNIKRKIKGTKLLNIILFNRITIIRLKALNCIDIYACKKVKSELINKIIEIINKKKMEIIENTFHELKNSIYYINIIKGFGIIDKIVKIEKNKLNYLFLISLKNIYNYSLKRHNIIFLEGTLYKLLMYRRAKVFIKIKKFSEKNKIIHEYNIISKIGNNNEKSIINNKLNKSNNSMFNNKNFINKSHDNIISNNINHNINKNNSSIFTKQNTAKKWLNNNKIDNTTFNFKIDSNYQRKIISPQKDFISFTISTNRMDKKPNSNCENKEIENDDEIWTINVEKWEANQSINDSFYKKKNDNI